MFSDLISPFVKKILTMLTRVLEFHKDQSNFEGVSDIQTQSSSSQIEALVASDTHMIPFFTNYVQFKIL